LNESAVAVTVFQPGEILWTAVLAAAVVALVFAIVPFTRTPSRILTASAGTFLGWLAWNFALHTTHAATFNVDAPVVAISWADAGSGIVTFVVVALLLGLWVDRKLRASRVIAMACLAGVFATIVDLFVL